jgi:hypothetical protein
MRSNYTEGARYYMGKFGLVIATIGVATLAACGSKTDTNAKNLGDEISRFLAKNGALCLGAKRWPVDIPESTALASSKPGTVGNELAALKTLGLLDAEITQAAVEGSGGKPVRVVRYTLTEKAVPFFRQQEVKDFTVNGMQTFKGGEFCVAKVVLDKVVKWDAPMKLGDYEETSVTYTYKVSDVADWERRPEFAAAYPKVVKFIGDSGKMELTAKLKKTSEGWETIDR